MQMTLIFPNHSRSYDEIRQGVIFTAYDGMFEIPFLVEASALRIEKKAISEERCLAAFDDARVEIRNAALRIYSGRKNTIYRIDASNLLRN